MWEEDPKSQICSGDTESKFIPKKVGELPLPPWASHTDLLKKNVYIYILMWTIFKVFIEFVTVLSLFHVLFFWL